MNMAFQPALPFDTREAPSILTLNGMVYSLMVKSGEWWMPHEICAAIRSHYGHMVSDSSVTARLRDLRKPAYGGHAVDKRIRFGSKAYEYKVTA